MKVFWRLGHRGYGDGHRASGSGRFLCMGVGYGVLADNIGLRSILRAYDRASGFLRQYINAGRIKRFVVIAINARTDSPEQLSHRERSPGLIDVFMKTRRSAWRP